MENYEIFWNTASKELGKVMSTISYDTFIKPLIPVDFKGDKLVILAYGRVLFDAVTGEKVASQIKKVFSQINEGINDFIAYDAKNREEYLKLIGESDGEEQPEGSPVNKKFTFDSFVVGPSNEYIFHAAKAVAEAPGNAYNPLFIYGGTGLGKTHILMAIANYLRTNSPSVRCLYVTCEQFTNQFIESISKGRNNGSDFRKKFRNVDVLLIDDVQFLAKKHETQAEFFHTFNELVEQDKQIVLTCDRPPQEIEVLEERLRTRFDGGLLVDVQPPDLETRIAILRRKAEEKKCLVDIKVLTYIAENDTGDIRSLIGKLTKVIFASQLHGRPITVSLVDDALKESAGEVQEKLQVDDIINCVSKFYKINKSDMLGKKKNREFTEPRQICTYLITEIMSSLPLDTVGQMMGGRDHATVIYSRDKIHDQMKTDTKLSTDINDIKNMLFKK